MAQAPRRGRSREEREEIELDRGRQRAMERGLQMRGGRSSDEYWQRPVRDPAMMPDLADPRGNIQRPNEFRMKKGGKVPSMKKYQKGGKVHSDEAMDRALIRKEIEKAKKGARFAKGGGVEIQGKTKGKLT